MKKVYILLSKTGSLPSRTIHLFTNKKYTHASISLTASPDGFCSYGRRYLHNFLIGGLIHEDVRKGIYKIFDNADCELLEIPVNDESYSKLSSLVDMHFDNYTKCRYKFSAIIPMLLGIKQELKFKMTCSQFVAKLLFESNSCKLPRHPSLMLPVDFLSIENISSIYTGKIKDIKLPIIDDKSTDQE